MSATVPPSEVSDRPDRPPLRVLLVGPPEPLDRGPAVYRTLQPGRALGELPDVTVVSGSTLSPAIWRSSGDGGRDLLTAADVLVLRDVVDPDLLPTVAERRRLGKFTAYEIGSHFLAARGPAGGAEGRPTDLVARSLIPQLARQADCLQLGTPALDAELAALNPRRAVFPSQLWEPPGLPAVRAADRVVIGWAGLAAERDDLASAVPALKGVLERHPEVRVSIMGDAELRETLAALPAARVSFLPAGSLERTYRFLDSLDVGIAPLLPTPYNRCTGDVRFVEYAAHGVLAVCADLDPYRNVVRPGQTGFLFRDAAELETVLERALAEPALRNAITARAARVAADRIERRHAAERLGFYLSVAAQMGLGLGHGSTRTPFPPPALLDIHEAPRVFPGSRYVALGGGKVDKLLAEGLGHHESGNAAAARRALEEAERLAPDSHLPPLLLGMAGSGAEAIAALGRAEARNPLSCRAAHLRGQRLMEAGDPAGAAEAFERARAIAPWFGAPQERLGALAEAAGRLDEACRFYEEAALQNSAFALPIARLATLAHKDGKVDKAIGLLERSLRDDPDLSLTNFLIGRAYLELRRFNQAQVHLRRALGGAPDRAAVLAELAKAEAGLGNPDAAPEAPPRSAPV